MYIRLIAVIAACTTCLPTVLGCQTLRTRNEPRAEDVDVTFVPTGTKREVTLSMLVRTPPKKPNAVIVIVPGSGDVSRFGRTVENGIDTYPSPLPVVDLWSKSLSSAGFLVLSYDKRTCTSRHDEACTHENPTDDVKEQGPRAMSADVDAVCTYARDLVDDQTPILLFAHGQAGQIALASACADDVDAFVWVAPVPDRVDGVLVRGLRSKANVLKQRAKKEKDSTTRNSLEERATKMLDQAGTLEATFLAIGKNQFPSDAQVMGWPLSFWRGWLAMTEWPGGKPNPKMPWIIVRGSRDPQLGNKDAKKVSSWSSIDDVALIELPKADHYLVDENRKDLVDMKPVVDEIMKTVFESTGAGDGQV